MSDDGLGGIRKGIVHRSANGETAPEIRHCHAKVTVRILV